METAGYLLIAIAAAAMLVAAMHQPDRWWPRLLSTGWLRAFGKYSYCLYLTHLPVMRTVEEFVLSREGFVAAFGSPWAGQLAFYALATGPSFGVAWLSWRAFEAPILRLKSRFPY